MTIAATAPIPQTLAADPSPPVRAGGAASSDDWSFTFHDLVSIVNPLQHFPIVSTLYRKLTGDPIKPFERVAGDTLYGGWIGLVSSVANLVFEKETGKDFGDTVLAMVDGDGDSKPAAANTGVASALPPSSAVATSTPRQPDSLKSDSGALALVSSMASAHSDTNLSQRALYAYRRSMEISPATADLRPAF
jgi:hypothetical protein